MTLGSARGGLWGVSGRTLGGLWGVCDRPFEMCRPGYFACDLLCEMYRLGPLTLIRLGSLVWDVSFEILRFGSSVW